MKQGAGQLILRIGISVLALGDGVLHGLLDIILFGGSRRPPTGGGNRPPGPPPNGPRPGGFRLPLFLPLNQLFILNLVGEVVLVLLFWLSRRLLGARRWLVDVAMILYASTTFVAWWLFGRPNPMGLGYLSKGMEIVLVIALLVDIWNIFHERAAAAPAAATPAPAKS